MTYRTETPPTNIAIAVFFEDGAPRRIEAHHPFTEARWNGETYITADGGALAGRLEFLGWLPLSEIRALAMARRAEYEALPGKTKRQRYVAAMTERAARANEVRRAA